MDWEEQLERMQGVFNQMYSDLYIKSEELNESVLKNYHKLSNHSAMTLLNEYNEIQNVLENNSELVRKMIQHQYHISFRMDAFHLQILKKIASPENVAKITFRL